MLQSMGRNESDMTEHSIILSTDSMIIFYLIFYNNMIIFYKSSSESSAQCSHLSGNAMGNIDS